MTTPIRPTVSERRAEEALAPCGVDVRYLAPRSLMTRWDCSKSSVYRALGEMERLGIYAGILVGKDRRVALSAVEAYERCLSRRASLEGAASRARGSSAPRVAPVLPMPRRAASPDRRRVGRAGGAPARSQLLGTFLAAARGDRRGHA
jgi:hypothetical protein